MRFQIRRSINNLYQARCLDDGKDYTLRIKGKVLKTKEKEYNPVAVGDIAIGEPYSENEAMILSIEDRKSRFTRWNVKAELNQTIAANHDMAAIVLSSTSPPFRPRFVDRAIASSHGAEILLIMNKCDFLLTEDEFYRWKLYHDLGYKLIAVSARTGENIDELRSMLKGKTTAFVGQSGVGKSSLINLLLGSNQLTGEVSDKYNRGCHTTNHSLFIEGDDFSLIDTPGVREILTPFEDASVLRDSFPEFRDLECYFSGCLHHGEQGCVVPELVEEGEIDADRYESYLRMLESLLVRKPAYQRTKGRNVKTNH
ncbi:MAG: ribosome small subunit-dependent GTPase A [Candidatus Ornithospirochaeta sp.]|nr:ribosome small subunit-dependent GTPase A [Candidatus Ornithospirochaeta sp.]